MAAIIIFAVAMLDLVRSKVEASGRALKTAAIQYSTVKRIYTASGDMNPADRRDQNTR
jgi:hypothetical protein